MNREQIKAFVLQRINGNASLLEAWQIIQAMSNEMERGWAEGPRPA